MPIAGREEPSTRCGRIAEELVADGHDEHVAGSDEDRAGRQRGGEHAQIDLAPERAEASEALRTTSPASTPVWAAVRSRSTSRRSTATAASVRPAPIAAKTHAGPSPSCSRSPAIAGPRTWPRRSSTPQPTLAATSSAGLAVEAGTRAAIAGRVNVSEYAMAAA
jgi:hypothetical protein